jgi:hypothetical protein
MMVRESKELEGELEIDGDFQNNPANLMNKPNVVVKNIIGVQL